MRIAVLGAGLMGHGIAQVFAGAGHEVSVYDPVDASLATLRARITANLVDLGLDTACVARVTGTGDLAAAVAGAGIVFEAALEDLAVKRELFARVEAVVGPEVVLASNTSVIPITAIMADLAHRGRALGTHWWNPPFLIPLVEVVGTEWTDAATVEAVMALLAAAGKTPVRVRKDITGFIGNRMQAALWREAISLVETGVCSAEDVDTVVKASFGRRLGVLGPLENADLIGTDLTLAIHKTMIPALDHSASPSVYLERLVAEGRLGMKSGAGFREWTEDQKAGLRGRLFAALRAAGPID
jgi:3-hydroxybutyryl-CoA dehydrogenase